MVSVCMYFQVHQPRRLRHYTVFDIGKSNDYFDSKKNREILDKISLKSYLPANNLLLNMIKRNPGFKVSFSFSGILLEQLEESHPEVIESFRKLVNTGNVEILDETYYHSLAFLYSKQEFSKQISMHRQKIKELFGYKPKVFRNTELIYNNELGKFVEGMGYKGILAEGADFILGWKSPNFVYTPSGSKISLLLKNYRLSDDIAFRFSNKAWKEWPLTSDKYVSWINHSNGRGDIVNLFMNYETFGEHQWKDRGIFNFFSELPKKIISSGNDFKTPLEVIDSYNSQGEINVPFPTSWADAERDLSAWKGNGMQNNALSNLYKIENYVLNTKNSELINSWRTLQSSDHFYYMSTKNSSDGDVHRYFCPYDTPYDSYIYFMNVFHDLLLRISAYSKNLSNKDKDNFNKIVSKRGEDNPITTEVIL